MVLFALVLAPASFVVALAALAPSVVYAVVERRNKEAVHCVTAFNLTGMMPVLGLLWGGDNSLSSAIALLSNPLSWLVMYGAVVVALAFGVAQGGRVRLADPRRTRDRGASARPRASRARMGRGRQIGARGDREAGGEAAPPGSRTARYKRRRPGPLESATK